MSDVASNDRTTSSNLRAVRGRHQRVRSLEEQVERVQPPAVRGRVLQTEGLVLHVGGLPAPVGAQVECRRSGGPPLRGEVVGFRDQATVVFPFGRLDGVCRGDKVRLVASAPRLRVGSDLLGCVVDARGKVLDRRYQPYCPDRVLLRRSPQPATSRPRIDQVLPTGIRALDGMLTCGRGQRLGIFAGSGVGKSVLLGMMARYTAADVIVIGLIGERGREVNEFLERDLGERGRERSVVVVATSDEPAVVRVQAAFAATAVAEYYCEQGSDVLLLMDSVTRFAMAQREIGLAGGEPPATRGYPPSVFALLPQLLERSGNFSQGSITGLYSVLVEGDDPNEPISDTVRGILDGHVLLSRELASAGHYPAIDILGSISRCMTELVSQDHLANVRLIRQLMATYDRHRDLITIGAYRQGSDPQLDLAVAMKPAIDAVLQQGIEEASSWEETVARIDALARDARSRMPSPSSSGAGGSDTADKEEAQR